MIHDQIKPPFPSRAVAERRVLLASNSPRRRELLAMIVPEFEVLKLVDVDETYPDTLPAEEVPAFLSRLKASACKGILKPNDIAITADTVVLVDNLILGKPTGHDDAVKMLKLLRGKTHKVITGVTLTWDSRTNSETFSACTDVTFGNLTDEEIEEYVKRFRPFDKAGAYGIQEWIGGIGIEGMNGSFYNVMGLPVKMLYDHLKAL